MPLKVERPDHLRESGRRYVTEVAYDRLGDKALSDLAGLGSQTELAIVGEYSFALFAKTEVSAGKSPARVAAFFFVHCRDQCTPIKSTLRHFGSNCLVWFRALLVEVRGVEPLCQPTSIPEELQR